MGRKRKTKDKAPLPTQPRLKQETKHTILAIVCFCIGVFFALAGFNRSGMAGSFLYSILTSLFGIGFFLVPLIFFMLAGSFIQVGRPNLVGSRLLAGALFFISSLGLVTVFMESKTTQPGGYLGYSIATPLVSLFDVYVTIVALVAIAVVSVIILFDTHVTFEFKLFGYKFFNREKKLAEFDEEDDDEPMIVSAPAMEEMIERPNTNAPTMPESAPKITAPQEEDGKAAGIFGGLTGFKKASGKAFVPPPLSLLERDSGKPGVGDIKANSNIIKRTLANFGITVEMDEISIGPSVTRYALKPAEGVKLAKIVALQNDLALALAAHPIRIEAPIPGKSLVGIEIPNAVKSTVGLASLLGTKEFAESPLPLLFAVGKGVSGMSHYTNIAKAPHLLIAGATGSGKSVTIHTLVTSLLYRNPPERLRFIMIDPKRVELTLYNKIPHLLTPVITDAKKAIGALRWAAKEMDRRYNILEAESVRDIQSYHKNVLEPALAKQSGNDEESADIEQMPYIVIVLDELADIMSTYPRELEAAIVRLAQMSRAVGIHLVLSTQRPSVEVITGLIKANVPSRIALQVASQIDSRTIIDMAGAEKLLGAGDMLLLSGEMSKPIRLQSAFISETEVKAVVNYLAKEYSDTLPQEINLGEENNNALFSSSFEGDSGDDDDLYEDAREAVMQAGKASASYLQRKLKVGYARAARLLDMLEERGVIGPGDGAKPREVYGTGTSSSNDDYGA